MFPLILVLPTEFNQYSDSSNYASFMLYGALGEGILAMIVGYLMQYITYNMLFYGMLTMAVIFYDATTAAKNQL